MRDLRILGFMLAFMCGALGCGWVYHAHTIAALESRIDQLEEDVNDAPPGVEAEDAYLSETEI